MVVRVKLDTTMGSMVRQLIAPVSAVQAKISFETVRGLYLLEYTLTCCNCQPALFSAMQAKISFETVLGLYPLEYAVTCCNCQPALLSAMQKQMSFEVVSGIYLLLKHIHVVDVKMLQSHPMQAKIFSMSQFAKMHLCPPYKRSSLCMPRPMITCCDCMLFQVNPSLVYCLMLFIAFYKCMQVSCCFSASSCLAAA